MVERLEAGTEAPPGVYRCTVCAEKMELEVQRELPPCTTCFNAWWEPVEQDSDA